MLAHLLLLCIISGKNSAVTLPLSLHMQCVCFSRCFKSSSLSLVLGNVMIASLGVSLPFYSAWVWLAFLNVSFILNLEKFRSLMSSNIFRLPFLSCSLRLQLSLHTRHWGSVVSFPLSSFLASFGIIFSARFFLLQGAASLYKF